MTFWQFYLGRLLRGGAVFILTAAATAFSAATDNPVDLAFRSSTPFTCKLWRELAKRPTFEADLLEWLGKVDDGVSEDKEASPVLLQALSALQNESLLGDTWTGDYFACVWLAVDAGDILARWKKNKPVPLSQVHDFRERSAAKLERVRHRDWHDAWPKPRVSDEELRQHMLPWQKEDPVADRVDFGRVHLPMKTYQVLQVVRIVLYMLVKERGHEARYLDTLTESDATQRLLKEDLSCPDKDSLWTSMRIDLQKAMKENSKRWSSG